MKLKNWYKIRGPKFIWQRGSRLLERYDLRPEQSIARIKACVSEQLELGCSPTFPTPGIIVQRYPKFIRWLQEAGVEITVHGYHHINLRDLPVVGAVQQLLRAAQTFDRFGIEVHGFRCPYLGYKSELFDALPSGLFKYSSNQSIYWEVPDKPSDQHKNLLFDTLNKFYDAMESSQKVCMPWMRSNMVEIPVCIPDDIQLNDGLLLGSEGLARAWCQILNQTHQRGELFTLLFHTELASLCDSPLGELIGNAKQYRPGVWIARLQDISDWWWEKSKFKIEITTLTTGLRLNFDCTSRGTILVRGLDHIEPAPIWDGAYHRVQSTVMEVPSSPRPFVGLATVTPESTVSFLREQGYILDTGETAKCCGIYLDENVLSKLTNEVALVKFIEASPAPLVRFWRWPDGRKSALCLSGDLDALTLIDYASRIFII